MTPTSTPPAFQPVTTAAPAAIRDRKTSKGLLFGLIGAAVVVTLGVVGLVQRAGGDQQFVALARSVPYGVKIQDQDLKVVKIVSDDGLTPVPAAQKADMVGKYATMPLAQGTLLTAAQVSADAIPGKGFMIVSVSQKADQAPAHPLATGTPVQVVRTGQDTATQGSDSATPMAPVKGTVLAVRDLQYGGGSVVDVVVPEAQGPMVAIAAAAGKVALVVTAGS